METNYNDDSEHDVPTHGDIVYDDSTHDDSERSDSERSDSERSDSERSDSDREYNNNTYSNIFDNKEIETAYKNYYKNEKNKYKKQKIHAFVQNQTLDGLNLLEEYETSLKNIIKQYANDKGFNITMKDIVSDDTNMYKLFSIVYDGGDNTKLNVWQIDKLYMYTNRLSIYLYTKSKNWKRDEKMAQGYKNIKSTVNKIINTDFDKHSIYSKHTIVKNELYYLYTKYNHLESIENIRNPDTKNNTLIYIYKEVQLTIKNIINTMRVFNEYDDLCMYQLVLPFDNDMYKLTYFNIIELELWTKRPDGLVDLLDSYASQLFYFTFCNDMLRDLTSKNKTACSYIHYNNKLDISSNTYIDVWTLNNLPSNVDEIEKKIMNQFENPYNTSILSIDVPEHATMAILIPDIGILYFNTGSQQYDNIIIPLLQNVIDAYNNKLYTKDKKIKVIQSNKTRCFDQIGPYCQSWSIFIAFLYVKNIEYLQDSEFLKELLVPNISSNRLHDFQLTRKRKRQNFL